MSMKSSHRGVDLVAETGASSASAEGVVISSLEGGVVRHHSRAESRFLQRPKWSGAQIKAPRLPGGPRSTLLNTGLRMTSPLTRDDVLHRLLDPWILRTGQPRNGGPTK